MPGNNTIIAYIKKQGATKLETSNDFFKEIWYLCMNKTGYISAAHIPGIHYTSADSASRNFQDAFE